MLVIQIVQSITPTPLTCAGTLRRVIPLRHAGYVFGPHAGPGVFSEVS